MSSTTIASSIHIPTVKILKDNTPPALPKTTFDHAKAPTITGAKTFVSAPKAAMAKVLGAKALNMKTPNLGKPIGGNTKSLQSVGKTSTSANLTPPSNWKDPFGA